MDNMKSLDQLLDAFQSSADRHADMAAKVAALKVAVLLLTEAMSDSANARARLLRAMSQVREALEKDGSRLDVELASLLDQMDTLIANASK